MVQTVYSDSSDADDSDYAPDKQPAVSMPALQIRSWLSNKPNKKYQPQMMTDLCRLMVQNSLPVNGVQGLLYDLTSILTGVTVSKVSSAVVILSTAQLFSFWLRSSLIPCIMSRLGPLCRQNGSQAYSLRR